MEHRRHYCIYSLLIILCLVACGSWYVEYRGSLHNPYLIVAFLDVGQGDAIYVEAPNGTQMLIDGGPNDGVLSKLAEVMPFGDRSIDLVVATHPDADHIGGLAAVIDTYNVPKIIRNGATSKTKVYQHLEDTLTKDSVEKIHARRGMHIILDSEKNIYFDILFPDRDASEFKETNDGSIVGKLVYGEHSFLLTGDATLFSENIIMNNEKEDTLHSTVLKLGHHGSRTSSTLSWLGTVHPIVAIISAGLDNRYGHPHKEILDTLQRLSIPYRATYKEGTIVYKTDGVQFVK